MNWVLLVLLSAILLGFRSIVYKKALYNHNTLSVLFLSASMTTILTLFFFPLISFNLSLSVLFLLIFKAVILCFSWFFFFEALKNLPISTVEPLKNLSPIFLLILGFFILGEVPTWIQLTGILVLIFGAYALELDGFHNFLSPFKFFKTKYFLFIVFSLLGNASSAVLDKILLRSISVQTMMFWYFLIITVCYALFILFKKENFNVSSTFKDAWWLILLTAVLLFGADFVYFIALTLPGVLITLVIPIRRLSSLIGTFVGGKIFNDKYLLYKTSICLLLIAGFVLIVI